MSLLVEGIIIEQGGVKYLNPSSCAHMHPHIHAGCIIHNGMHRITLVIWSTNYPELTGFIRLIARMTAICIIV